MRPHLSWVKNRMTTRKDYTEWLHRSSDVSLSGFQGPPWHLNLLSIGFRTLLCSSEVWNFECLPHCAAESQGACSQFLLLC